MPSLDQRYIEKLSNFTKALEGIVELLQQDSKNDNVDNVNRMLSSMNENLNEVVKNMEIVVKSVGKIETQNDKILREIQEVKKSKDSSGFGNIGEVDNKKKITDAVKIIMVIAGGILAIGLAFKLISPVDFLSVIAIGLSLLFISGAFVAISSITKNMESKDIFKTSGLLVLISGAITISSWVLSMVSNISPAKALSIVFVAGAMGASLVLIAKSVSKINLTPKDYLKILLLPIILPVIAFGITVSSLLLSTITPLSLMQAITAVFVAGVIGTSLFLISKALENSKMEGKHVSQILLLPILIPAIALGIVLSSRIFQMVSPLTVGQALTSIFVAVTIGVLAFMLKPLMSSLEGIDFKKVGILFLTILAISSGIVAASKILSFATIMSVGESFGLILTSLAIGLAVLFITPAILLLKGIKSSEFIDAGKNIVIASTAIAFSSLILSMGMYNNYPDLQWSIGSGLSILSFVGVMLLLKNTKLTSKEFLTGGLTILGISTIIAATSFILSLGNYDTYPSLDWAVGVGLSLIAFGTGMMVLGLILTNSGGSIAVAMAVGALAVLGISLIIVATSLILSMVNYDKYPTLNWVLGVSLTLLSFAGLMGILGLALPLIALGSLSMILIAKSISKVSDILSEGEYDTGLNREWAESVNLLMSGFTKIMIDTAFIPNKILESSASGLLIISQSIVDVSKNLALGDYKNGPGEEWSKNTMSVINGFSLGGLILANPFILFGLSNMLLVSNIIAESANILAKGDYSGGPNDDWSKGVGNSIKAFAEGLVELSSTGGLFGKIFGFNNTGIITKIARAMVDSSFILKEGLWDQYPSPEWSSGVGNSIKAFADAMVAMERGDIDSDDFEDLVVSISKGLIKSAEILNDFDWSLIKNYPSSNWAKGVGDAINAFAIPIAKMAEADVKISPLLLNRIIVSLAHSMVSAASIINKFDWDSVKNNYPSEDWVNGVGKSLGIFMKYLIEIEKNDIGKGDLRNLNRTISTMISTAYKIKIADMLLPGIWADGPSSKWSENTGKAINSFVKYLVEIEKNDIGKGDLKILNSAINSMIRTAYRFKIASLIFDDIWESGPKLDWSDRTGKVIEKFIEYLIKIEKNDVNKNTINNLNNTIDLMIASAIRFKIAESFFDNMWEYGPTINWSDKIGKSLGTFVNYLVEIEKNDIGRRDIKNIDRIIDVMISSAMKLYEIEQDVPDIWKTGPSENWAKGIEQTINSFVQISKMGPGDSKNFKEMTISILYFLKMIENNIKNQEIFGKGGSFEYLSNSLNKLNLSLSNSQNLAKGIDTLSTALLKISSMGTSTTDSIRMLSRSILELSESLENVDMESIDKLSKFSNGILVLSLIDEKKFEKALEILDSKKNDIISILSDNNTIKSRPVIQGSTSLQQENTNNTGNNRNKFYDELLKHVKNLDLNVNRMLDIQNQNIKIEDDIEDDVVNNPKKTTEKSQA